MDFTSDSAEDKKIRLPAVNVSASFGGGLPPSATVTLGPRK